MSQAYKVAVVGLGYFSQFHLDAWHELDNCRLIAVADTDAAKLERPQNRFGVAGYLSLGELLANEKPDIVDLVVPPRVHQTLIADALSSVETIICQKPFCANPKQAKSVVAQAADANTNILVHENFRFQPWYRDLKHHLEGGMIGEIYQCRFQLRPGDGRGPDAYLARQPAFQSMERFLVRETAVHFFDLFRWLFGDIGSIYADLRQLNQVIAGEDAGTILIEHITGVRSVFDGNRLLDHKADDLRKTMGEMVIEGEGGTITLDGDGQLHLRRFGQTAIAPLLPHAPRDQNAFGGGCVKAFNRHVLDGLRGGKFETTAKDYLPVIECEQAAYLSHAEARKITLPL